jgi:DNA-binding NarL/FixJ family response regulator
MVKVLIIDDEECMRRAIPRFLRHDLRFDCTPCAPDEALEKVLAGEKFDIVLSDVTMGPWNGASLRSRILSIVPELEKRYLFMSGGISSELAPLFEQENVLDKANLLKTIIPALESKIQA